MLAIKQQKKVVKKKLALNEGYYFRKTIRPLKLISCLFIFSLINLSIFTPLYSMVEASSNSGHKQASDEVFLTKFIANNAV